MIQIEVGIGGARCYGRNVIISLCVLEIKVIIQQTTSGCLTSSGATVFVRDGVIYRADVRVLVWR